MMFFSNANDTKENSSGRSTPNKAATVSSPSGSTGASNILPLSSNSAITPPSRFSTKRVVRVRRMTPSLPPASPSGSLSTTTNRSTNGGGTTPNRHNNNSSNTHGTTTTSLTTPSKTTHKHNHYSQSPANTSLDWDEVEYTVIFEPGPVGLQLEPVTEDPKYGCRVVRFVDDFPTNPGQARRSGKIHPGDLVVQVLVDNNDKEEDDDKKNTRSTTTSKAAGVAPAATTYEEIIKALKQKHCKRRIMTFRSVWDSTFLDTQSSLKSKFSANASATTTANHQPTIIDPRPPSSNTIGATVVPRVGVPGLGSTQKRTLTIQTAATVDEDEKEEVETTTSSGTAAMGNGTKHHKPLTTTMSSTPGYVPGLGMAKKHATSLYPSPSSGEEEDEDLAQTWNSPPPSATKGSATTTTPSTTNQRGLAAVRFTPGTVTRNKPSLQYEELSTPTGRTTTTTTTKREKEDNDLMMTPFSQSENFFLHDPETPAIPAMFHTTTNHHENNKHNRKTPSPIRFHNTDHAGSPTFQDTTTMDITMVHSPSQLVLLSSQGLTASGGGGKDMKTNSHQQETVSMRASPSPPPPTTLSSPQVSTSGGPRENASPLRGRGRPPPPPPPPRPPSSLPPSRAPSPSPSRRSVPPSPSPRSSSYPPRHPPHESSTMTPTEKQQGQTPTPTPPPPPPPPPPSIPSPPTSGPPSRPLSVVTTTSNGAGPSSSTTKTSQEQLPGRGADTSVLTSATAYIVREFCGEGEPTPLSERGSSPTNSLFDTPHPPSSTPDFNRLLSPPMTMDSITTQLEPRQFSPSNVKKLAEDKKKTISDGSNEPKLFSRVFSSVYRNVGPAVATSSYVVGSAVVHKVVPTVASSSYALGSAFTSKLGEAIVGNSADDFQKESALKLQLLQELSQAKVALEVQGLERTKLEQSVGDLLQENQYLRTTLEELVQVNQTQLEDEQSKQEELRKEQDVAIQELQRQLGALEAKNRELQGTMAAMENNVEETTRDLQSRLDEANSALDKKEDVLDRATHLVKSQEEEISMLDTEKKSVEEELQALRMELDMSRSMVQGMESHILELETAKANLTEDFQSMEREASESNDRLLQSLHDKEKEVSTLQETLETKHASTCELEKTFLETRAAVEEELANLKSRNESLSERNTELESMNGNFQIEARELHATLEGINKKLETQVLQCEQLDCELQKTRLQIQKDNELHGRVLREKEQSFAKYKLECDSGVQSLMADLQEKGELIRNLEASKVALSNQVEQLTNEGDTFRSENATLQEELDRMSSNLLDAKNDAAETHDQLLQQLENGASQTHLEIEQKAEELAHVIQSLQEANNKIGVLESELDCTREKVLSSSKVAGVLQEERDDLHERCDELEARQNENEESLTRLTAEKETAESLFGEAQKEIQRLETQVSALQTIKQELEQQVCGLEGSKKEFSEVMQSLEEANGKVGALESELDSTTEKVVALTKTVEGLQEERNELEARHDEKEESMARLIAEKESAKSQYGEAQKEMIRLESQVSELQTSKQGLEQQVLVLEKSKSEQLSDATGKIQSLEQSLGQRSAELALAVQKLGSLEMKHVKSLKRGTWIEIQLRKSEKEAGRAEVEAATLKEQLKALKSSIASMEKQLQCLLHENAAVQAQNRSKIDSLREQLQIKSKELEVAIAAKMVNEKEAKDALDRLKDEKSIFESQLREANDRIFRLESDVESLQSSKSCLEEKVDQLSQTKSELLAKSTDHVQSLQSQLDHSTKELESATDALKALKEELDVALASQQEVESQCDSLRSSLSEAKGRITTLIEQTATIEACNATLKNDLQRKTDMTQTLQTQLQENVDDISAIRGTVLSLEKDKKDLNAERDMWASKASASESDYAQAARRALELEEQISNLTNDRDTLKSKVEEVQKSNVLTVAELNRKIALLESDSVTKETELEANELNVKALGADLWSVVQERNELGAKVSDVSTKLSAELETNSSLESSVCSLEKAMKSLEEKLELVHRDAEESQIKAREEIASLESRLENSARELKAAEDSVSLIKAERDTLKTALEDEKPRVADANEKNSALENTLSALESSNSTMVAELAARAMTIATLESQQAVLSTDREHLEGHLLDTQSRLKGALEDISRLEDDKKKQEHNMSEELSRTSSLGKSLEIRLEKCLEDLSSARDELKALEAAKDSVENERDLLKSNNLQTGFGYYVARRRIPMLEHQLEGFEFKAQSLSDDLESKSRVSDRLERRIMSLEAEIEDKENQLSSGVDTIKNMEADKQALGSEVIALKANLTAAASEGVNAMETISTLERCVASLKSEIEVTANQLSKTSATASSLERDFDAVEKEKEGLEAKLASTESELFAARETISTIRGSLAFLESEVSEKETLQRSVVSLQSEIASKSEQLASVNATVLSLEDEKHDLEKKLANLESALSTAAETISTLEASVSSFESEVSFQRVLAEKVSSLEEDKQVLAKDKDFLEFKLVNLEADLSTATEKIATLESSISTLSSQSSERDVMQLKVDSLESDMKTKSNQLLAAVAAVASLEDERDILRERLLSSDSELSAASEKISNLEGLVSSMESEISDRDDLNDKVASLELDIEAKLEELSNVVATVTSLEDEKQSLTTQKNSLEAELMNTEFELSSATDKISSLEASISRLENSASERDALKEKLSQSRDTTTVMEMKVTALESSELDLRDKLATLTQSKTDECSQLLKQISSLGRQLEDRSEECLHSATAIDALEAEKKQIHQRCQEFEAKLLSCQAEAGKAQSLILSLNEDINSLESSKSSLKAELDGQRKLSADTKSLDQAKIDTLESQVERTSGELVSAKEILGKLEVSHHATLSELASCRDEKVALESQLKGAESDVTALGETIVGLERSKSMLEKNISLLDEEKNEISLNMVERLNTLEAQLEAVTSQKTQIEIELEHMSAASVAELRDARLKNVIHRKRIDFLQSNKSAILEAKEKSAALAAEFLLQSTAETRALKAKLGQLEEYQMAEAGKLRWSETERRGLVIRTIELNLHLSRARSDLSQLGEQVGSLEASKNATEMEYGRLCERIEEHEELLASNAVQMVSHVENTKRLEEALSHQTGAVEASSAALEALRCQNSKLFNDLAAAKDRAATEGLAMDAEMNSVKAEAAIAQQENDHLKERARSLQVELDESREHLERSHRDAENLKAEILKLDRCSKAANIKFEEVVVTLKKELSTLQLVADGERESNHKLKAQEQSLLEKIHELELSNAAARALSEKNQAGLEEMTTALALQKRDAKLLQDACASLRDECGRLKDHAIQLEKTHAGQLEAVENTHREMRLREEEHTHELTRSLASARSRNEELGESLSRSQQEVEDLNRQVQEIMHVHDEVVSDIRKTHSADVDKFAMERDNLKNMFQGMEEASKELQSMIAHKDELLLSEQNERGALSKQKESLSKSLHEAEDIISELRCELLILHEEGNESSDDSTDSELDRLSKAELKVECLCLQEELLEAETRATQSKNEGSKHARRAKGLEADLVAVSKEMDLLLQTNRNLEQRIVALLADKASLEASSETLTRAHRDTLQETGQKLQKCSVEKSLLSLHVGKLQDKIDSSFAEFELRKQEFDGELEQLQRTFLMLKAECAVGGAQIQQQSKEIATLMEQRTASQTKTNDLENQLRGIQRESAASEESLQARLQEAERKIESLSLLLNDQHADESVQIRGKFEEVSRKIEGMRSTLQCKDAEIEDLTDNLSKKHEYAKRMDALREGAVVKLSDASKTIASQRAEVTMLRSRLEQEEKAAALLSKEVGRLLDSRDLTDQKHQAELQVLQQKLRQLLEERHSTKAQVEDKQEDLRQSSRKSAQLERINESLQERVHEMKKSLSEVKKQLRQACDAYEESASSCRNLQKDLADKRVQIDHGKAKVQVLEATIARLNSNGVLHERDSTPAAKSATTADKEVKHLRTEMQIVTTHLSSVSSALQYEKKAASEMRMSEETLVKFIEEVIGFATGAQREIMARTLLLQRLEKGMAPSRLLLALDLPGMVATPDVSIWEVRSCLNKLASLVTKALKELHVKRTDFNQWKDRHSKPAAVPITPTFASAKMVPITPNHDEHRDIFGRIRSVLHESTTESGSIHLKPERVQMVEGLMDKLLGDLQATEIALLDKSKLFTEMENLVSQQDSERMMLEKRIGRLDTENREFEKKMEMEASSKKSVELELLSLRKAVDTKRPVSVVSMGGLDSASKATAKVAAARLMCSVLDRKAKAEAAGAFRKWSCAASTITAVQNQKEAAVALAQQLEMTREKLFVLKNHLKQGRRSHHPSSGGENLRKPRLRRLLDRLDKREKREPSLGEGGEQQ